MSLEKLIMKNSRTIWRDSGRRESTFLQETRYKRVFKSCSSGKSQNIYNILSFT